jgi:hypothetical protein
MKGKYIGIIAFFLVIVLLIASCNLFPPDLTLRVVNPSYAQIGGTNNVRITFKLHNSGSETLQNCKVRWYVDDIDSDGTDADIEYDEITNWAPVIGVNLAGGETSAEFTVDTTSDIFIGGVVNFYGIYEMGWNYSSDE